jgi:hypothetical protein
MWFPKRSRLIADNAQLRRDVDKWRTHAILMTQERNTMRTDRAFWRGLAILFDEHYVCETCDEVCASHLEGCQNPLHVIHDAIYDLPDSILRAGRPKKGTV